jgi:hypothetical protein
MNADGTVMAQGTRGISTGMLALELDGTDAGFLYAVEGGEQVATVVSEEADPEGVVRKHLGELAIVPIQISFGSGMGEPLYQWMTDWLKGERPARRGAVVFLDNSFEEQSRLEFEDALITELAFPALDASSKDQARFSLTLRPGATHFSKASAGIKRKGRIGRASKALLASEFSLSIDKLQTARVTSVAALVVKQPITRDTALGLAVPEPLEFPDLVFTLPESDAGESRTWFEDLAIAGNGGPINERSGTLEFIGRSTRTALFTLTLSHLGVYHVHRLRTETGSEAIARVRVAAYCEQIEFSFASGTDGVSATTPAP